MNPVILFPFEKYESPFSLWDWIYPRYFPKEQIEFIIPQKLPEGILSVQMSGNKQLQIAAGQNPPPHTGLPANHRPVCLSNTDHYPNPCSSIDSFPCLHTNNIHISSRSKQHSQTSRYSLFYASTFQRSHSLLCWTRPG